MSSTRLMESMAFAGYSTPPGHYDECFAASGECRPAYRHLVQHINNLGGDALDTLVTEGAALVRDSGITYNALEEQGERTRPWELSFTPLVIQTSQWQSIESGLQQRTRLLEAVMNDLLGPQRLLRERVIPPDAILRNPDFLRVYHGLPKSGGARLHVIATDLARDPSGQWTVMGDRTRAPSGLGYLVENRIITSRAHPDLIQHSNVLRIAPFFRTLRQMFETLSPQATPNPRVAILTPGQKSYRHFEDTYLARYLGYILVQGRDLAVRNGVLNLKTLGGLQPIDVLWRHVSDEQCDPLELDPAAAEGVTGLVAAVRSNRVGLANCLGSQLMQSPSLLPYLPAASRFLFSEELSLPTVTTLWCGDPESCRQVLADLDRYVIRPAFKIRGDRPTRPHRLSENARAELVAAIQANPSDFVAQIPISRSTTPVWRDGKMQSWCVALRSFQIQNAGQVDVLPGGLARVSPTSEGVEIPHSSAQLGQDCWVIADEPVDHSTTLLPPPHVPLKFVRGGAELPSRVAENMFWLGRYSERCESLARLLRTTMIRLVGEQAAEDKPEVPRLVAALAAAGQIEPDYAVKELQTGLPSLDIALTRSLFDSDLQRGLRPSVLALADSAIAVRDRISLDAYRIVQQIELELSHSVQSRTHRDVRSAITRLTRLITGLVAFAGLGTESFTRSLAWRFLQLGRSIERAWQTAELLRATLVNDSVLSIAEQTTVRFSKPATADPNPSSAENTDRSTADPIPAAPSDTPSRIADNALAIEWADDERPVLEAVLETTDSIMTYRSRYLLRLEPDATLDLLISDDTNPRSILFQLERIVQILELPMDSGEVGMPHERRLALDLLHRVRMAQPVQLSVFHADGRRQALDQLLEILTEGLPELSNAISARYLTHTISSQKLTGHA